MAGSEGTKACRLCLTMENNLVTVDIQLENDMKSILGQNISYESGLPKYACDECATFLRRFKEFREKCLIAQTVLYNILKTAGQVTEAEIQILNRKRLKLDRSPSALSEKVALPHEEEEPCNMASVVVKVEAESVGMEEGTGSENGGEVFVEYELFESESEDISNPLEEHTGVKKEVSLPDDHEDLKEGFTKSVPPLLTPKVEMDIGDELDHSAYHCDECCRLSDGEDDLECPHLSQICGKVKRESYMEFRKSENARKKRFLDKMTPEQRALKRQRDLESYHRRKAQKNLIVSGMSEQEKNRRREQWKKSSRKYRVKKKDVKKSVDGSEA